ncbi:MAG: 4'-phosphopantetheinyl transferase family protein [Candidatus Dormibacteraceae bacterium]
MRTAADMFPSLADQWRTPPNVPTLQVDEVHVWRASLLTNNTAQLTSSLSQDERQRAKQFRFEHHRERYIRCRILLRALLSTYMGADPGQLRFRYNAAGKPELDGHNPMAIRFNVSNSCDCALYALTRHRSVGIDLEKVRFDFPAKAIGSQFFAPREYDALCDVERRSRQVAFFRLWTAKEAYVKATGAGLQRTMNDFDTSASLMERSQFSPVISSVPGPLRWSVRPLTPWPGYIGALALEGDGTEVKCWDATSSC